MVILLDTLVFSARDLEVEDFLVAPFFFIDILLHTTFFYSITVSFQSRFIINILNIFFFIFDFLFFFLINFFLNYVFFFRLFRFFYLILVYIINLLSTLYFRSISSRTIKFCMTSLSTD